MMLTDLSYIEFGERLAIISALFFAVVVGIRLILAFRNYIRTGDFGDLEKSLFNEMLDHGNFFTVYTFTGYHPGIIIMDVLVFTLFSITLIPFWSVYIVGGLLLVLAKIMRARIAVKQEFVAKLDGTHDDD